MMKMTTDILLFPRHDKILSFFLHTNFDKFVHWPIDVGIVLRLFLLNVKDCKETKFPKESGKD